MTPGWSANRKLSELPTGRQSLNWRYIAITLIDLGFECNGLITAVTVREDLQANRNPLIPAAIPTTPAHRKPAPPKSPTQSSPFFQKAARSSSAPPRPPSPIHFPYRPQQSEYP